MSKKASKSLIGLFVLGAIALVVVGVVLFGSGKLFSPTKRYVMYFDGSVKGLSVGAPVVFRGVKIGSVIHVILQGDLHDMRFRVPVIVEIDLSRFQFTDVDPEETDYDRILVERGLRAQLQTQSLVTGQLMIDIDFRPDRPPHVVKDTTGYPQIPTVPSTAEELAQKLEQLPLQQLVDRLNELVGGLDRLVNSPEMQDIPRSINLAVGEARNLFATIDGQLDAAFTDARAAIGAATAVIERADRVLTFEEGAPAALLENLSELLDELRQTMLIFDETMVAVRTTASDERSKYELRTALRDLGETSRALGALIDYLDRHPETLLRGKTNVEKP